MVDYLKGRYAAQVVLLYGSMASGTETPESDIDVTVFAPVTEESHDSQTIGGFVLDAWIYPLERVTDPAIVVHIVPFLTLWDELAVSEALTRRIEDERTRQAEPFTPAKRAQTEAWIAKMLLRSSSDSPEANYRYHWLLNDLPELFCRFTAQYYDGPVKTIRRMQGTHPDLHRKYSLLLSGTKNLELLREVYAQLVGPPPA